MYVSIVVLQAVHLLVGVAKPVNGAYFRGLFCKLISEQHSATTGRKGTVHFFPVQLLTVCVYVYVCAHW